MIDQREVEHESITTRPTQPTGRPWPAALSPPRRGRRFLASPLAMLLFLILFVPALPAFAAQCIELKKSVSGNGPGGPFVRNSETAANPNTTAANLLIAFVPGSKMYRLLRSPFPQPSSAARRFSTSSRSPIAAMSICTTCASTTASTSGRSARSVFWRVASGPAAKAIANSRA